MAQVHYCSQLCGVWSLSRLVCVHQHCPLPSSLFTLFWLLESRKWKQQPASRVKFFSISMSYHPGEICFLAVGAICWWFSVFFYHSQMVHRHDPRPAFSERIYNKLAEVEHAVCFLYIPPTPPSVVRRRGRGLSLWRLWDAERAGDWRCCQPEASLTFIRLQIASQITLKDRGRERVGVSEWVGGRKRGFSRSEEGRKDSGKEFVAEYVSSWWWKACAGSQFKVIEWHMVERAKQCLSVMLRCYLCFLF